MLVLPSLFELCLGLLELAPRRLGLNSANSGKGERLTSLPLSALFLDRILKVFGQAFVRTGGAEMALTRRSRGWPMAEKAF